jgi:hypothetical protein
MSLTENRTTFTFNHSGQPDEYGVSVGDYTVVQANYDSRAAQNLTDINNIKDTLKSDTDGDSGAHNIKSAGIAGILNGAKSTVYAILVAIKALIDAVYTDITINRKLSPTGDFTGTWNSVQMTAAEPGLSSAFNAHLSDIANMVGVEYPVEPKASQVFYKIV